MFKRRYLSAGLFPGWRQKYGQVFEILSVFITMSVLMVLIITLVDVGGYKRFGDLHSHERDLITIIQILTIIFTVLQVLSLLCLLAYTTFPSLTRENTYVLSLAVSESEGNMMTMYGSTASTGESIKSEDICIFYHRVTGGNCQSFCEPLSLPVRGLHLPVQVLCLLISISLDVVHSALLDMDTFYLWLAVVTMVNSVQQAFLTFLSYLTSTDTGCCCLGISITRWFIHTDIYTKTLEKLVKQSFNCPEKDANQEWYKSTLTSQTPADTTARADQVKILQNYLENWHEKLYKEVFLGQEAVSLFITKMEMDMLKDVYTRKMLCTDPEENVVFQKESSTE